MLASGAYLLAPRERGKKPAGFAPLPSALMIALHATTLLVSLLALVLTNGCIVKRETYLKPIGKGSYLRNACSGQERWLAFEVREGLAASVSVEPRRLYLYFYVAAGHSLSINSPYIGVFTNASGWRQNPLDGLAYYLPFDSTIESSYKSTEELKGSRVPESHFPTIGRYFMTSWEKYRWYRIRVDLTPPMIEDFTMRWPRLSFDGEPLQLQDVSIQQVTELVRYPLMC